MILVGDMYVKRNDSDVLLHRLSRDDVCLVLEVEGFEQRVLSEYVHMLFVTFLVPDGNVLTFMWNSSMDSTAGEQFDSVWKKVE